jgi:hypothetical protein
MPGATEVSGFTCLRAREGTGHAELDGHDGLGAPPKILPITGMLEAISFKP